MVENNYSCYLDSDPFGKGKISSIMGDLAKGIKSFKKGMSDDNSSDNDNPNNNSDNSNSENK